MRLMKTAYEDMVCALSPPYSKIKLDPCLCTHFPPPCPGVVIFVCLICATVRVAPEPLALGSSALSKLEQRLYAYGKTNLYELLETVESWEAKVLKVGSSGLGSIEERLGSFGLHNLHDLVEFQETLRRYGKRGVKELSGFGRLIR